MSILMSLVAIAVQGGDLPPQSKGPIADDEVVCRQTLRPYAGMSLHNVPVNICKTRREWRQASGGFVLTSAKNVLRRSK